jgi:hypothetical protein
MTDQDIFAAATILAPLIATTITPSRVIPEGLFPVFAKQVVDLAEQISSEKHNRATRPR